MWLIAVWTSGTSGAISTHAVTSRGASTPGSEALPLEPPPPELAAACASASAASTAGTAPAPGTAAAEEEEEDEAAAGRASCSSSSKSSSQASGGGAAACEGAEPWAPSSASSLRPSSQASGTSSGSAGAVGGACRQGVWGSDSATTGASSGGSSSVTASSGGSASSSIHGALLHALMCFWNPPYSPVQVHSPSARHCTWFAHVILRLESICHRKALSIRPSAQTGNKSFSSCSNSLHTGHGTEPFACARWAQVWFSGCVENHVAMQSPQKRWEQRASLGPWPTMCT
mmetsp:Transcript_87810/g.283584  ORF Transcript_87810/g.283584 Transcript_87810/m.283584 type:complete len:287 (-) Transcript_87810:664-1524(-)